MKDENRRIGKPGRHCGRFLQRLGSVARCRSGATAVEFGIVAPLFLAMMLGLFEMSRAMWIKASMQFAVEEATRSFMVNNALTTSDLEAAATAALSGTGLEPSNVTFSATQDTLASGVNIMKVEGTHNFSAFVPFIPFPDVTLSAKSSAPFNSS